MQESSGVGTPYLLRAAQGSGELEAVFRFRYEHFFHSFPDGYPGMDRARHRIFGPHDLGSTHYCAFDAAGNLCAVSTATPAGAPDVPPSWQQWLQLGRLASLDLEKVVVSTRMVIHPGHRGHGLFERFYCYIMERYLEAGFEYAVHYCSPGFISRYEHLGHRPYGEPFTVPPGLLRVPMLIAFNDPGHLRRVRSPLIELCAARAARFGPSRQGALVELTMIPNFRLLSPGERLAYVLARVGTDRLPEPPVIQPVLEYASPLRLKAGLAHAAPPGGGFPCLILTGSLCEKGADRAADAGSFAGAGLLGDPTRPSPSFNVAVDSEILVFDVNLTHAAARIGSVPDDPRPWRCLRLACDQPLFAHQTLPGIKEGNPCGTRL